MPTLTTRSSDHTADSSKSRASSTRPSKAQYQLIEDVEDLDRYCSGGYHPLQIGDELARGRYRLVNKLGYGGYSTIWLARDLCRARYVAVKVITADASCTHEASLLSSLSQSSRPGREIIPSLIDDFWITGPNGRHECVVTSPAQMSLFDSKEASISGLFHLNVAQSIIAQLIRGVAFLHHENIVHGDLHLGNILVQFPRMIDRFPTSELYERYGQPESEAVIRLDGKRLVDSVPARVFIPGWFGVPSDEVVLGDEKILLSDFGESFNPDTEPRFSSKTLPLLQPPEARFSDRPLSFASDIWTLACTIWEILGQRPLFEAYFPTVDRVTMEQVEALGRLPLEWWRKWDRRLEWFDEEGKIDLKPEMSRDHEGMRRTWDRRFEHCIQKPRAAAGLETLAVEERKACEKMLRSMLTFRPEERATAQQVMQSEWMKGWGLPSLEQSRRTSGINES
ncbi:kinase domain-containing protein [Aspergillus campestris IBT 28561]|uniref:non-specific serine/threonine protein kinase n=1 Tax=Aspergillus campestris (strain IBT 28561) TaxID=1392248 RepID=A0A2I1CXB5_ASPC2|nr:kinase domain-containing protein [Aspergillus campestris IBT 28561]PKY02269.1 kinase domain-containing protein [Aspergillus campestris IBT 28561]